MSILTVFLVQFESYQEKEKNLEKALRVINSIDDKSDIVIFPEYMMGYPTDNLTKKYIVENAETEQGPFISAIKKKAKEQAVAIIFNTFEKDASKIYNTVFAVDNHGEITAKYRKIHLFTIPGHNESDLFTPGNDFVVFSYKDFTIGLATCFDLRFPELFRKNTLKGAQIFLVPSAWYKGLYKEEQWLVLGQARALENGVFVVGVGNSATPFIGRSYVADPLGVIRLDLGIGEKTTTFKIDLNELHTARESMSLLNLRRSDLY